MCYTKQALSLCICNILIYNNNNNINKIVTSKDICSPTCTKLKNPLLFKKKPFYTQQRVLYEFISCILISCFLTYEPTRDKATKATRRDVGSAARNCGKC